MQAPHQELLPGQAPGKFNRIYKCGENLKENAYFTGRIAIHYYLLRS